MSGDDEVATVLRRIADERKTWVEKLAQGGVPADNTRGGYMSTSGFIRGLDAAEVIVRDVFRGWLPEVLKPKEAPKSGDY